MAVTAFYFCKDKCGAAYSYDRKVTYYRYKYVTKVFPTLKGTIKTVLALGDVLGFLRFNSIKVRLKHLLALKFGDILEFQFHKGTIKTEVIGDKRKRN